MVRKFFRKQASQTSKLDAFLDKYNLSRTYFGVSRRAVTRGIWIGLFWAFIPMPLQMLAVILTTPLLRFNVPIAMVMVWLSNPLTMPAMYYMEYLTGNFLLGREGVGHIELTLEWFTTHFNDIVVPLYVGTAFYSIVVSTLIYFTINWLWVRSVHKEKAGKRDNN
jgi:uncharacterized protein (DUF2062 family)